MTSQYNPPPTYADPIVQQGERWAFNPIWLKWFVDLASQLRFFSGSSTVVATDTVSQVLPSGVATKVYTFTPGRSAMYLVAVSAEGATTIADYSAYAVVMTAGSTAGATWVNNGAKQSIHLSGMDLMVKQSSGSDLRTVVSVTQIG